MSAMYRLKAYFGMVPADELGDYVDDGVDNEPRYPTQRRGDRWDERAAPSGGYDYDTEDDDPRDVRDTRESRSDSGWERSRTAVRSVAPVGARGEASRLRTPATVGVPVQGALAIDRSLDRDEEPVERVRPEEVSRTVSPARITTLQPRSYNEARTIGERYRDGVPVIMNLTELDDAAAKRLVDFAAGLAFALRGSIDKVTSRVFLLTPPEVEVSADDARMLAERSRHFGDA